MKTRKLSAMLLTLASGAFLFQNACATQLGSLGLAALTSALSANQTALTDQSGLYNQQGYYPTGQNGMSYPYGQQGTGYYYPTDQSGAGYPYYPQGQSGQGYYPYYPQGTSSAGQGTTYPYYPPTY